MTGPLFLDPYQKLCRVRLPSKVLEINGFAVEYKAACGFVRSKKGQALADAQIMCVGRLFPSRPECGLHEP